MVGEVLVVRRLRPRMDADSADLGVGTTKGTKYTKGGEGEIGEIAGADQMEDA